MVERVIASGTPFVLVTGRPPRWIPPIAKHLPGVTLAVCANGAVRYDIAGDRVLSASTLRPETLARLGEVCAEALPGAWLAVERVGRSAFEDVDKQFVCEPGYRHAYALSDHVVVPRDELFAQPAVKLLVRNPDMTSDEMVAVLEPVLGGSVALTFSSPNGFVELATAGVTKASGLAEVAGDAGVDRADVIAFGDMPNDVPMLTWAGHGVAMGNAHPDALAVADEVTAPAAEDGVALVLERWF
ncbi:Cof-type HAD-IIB family hydrolase [Pseudonocardia eucalypti]|uniref:Cof-type HAD-IIB family hydrolase n=1 Tax=Pseudonocardia eucalypti TaxID=648755 RepID=A0ABP9QXU4_9PSEU